MNESIPVTMNLSKETVERIDAEASRKARTRSGQIRFALEQCFPADQIVQIPGETSLVPAKAVKA